MTGSEPSLGRRIVRKAPRAAFPLADWYFAVYAGFGFLLSGLLHVWVWSQRSDQLQPWVRRFGLEVAGFSLSAVVATTVVLALIVGVVTLVLFRLVETAREAVFWSAQLAWIFPVLSQLIASSVTKFVYEITFSLVAGGGFLITTFVLEAVDASDNPPVDVWKLFRTMSRAVLGLTALLVGSVATAILSRFNNVGLYNQEITRQILLLGYYGVGVFVLLFSPILVRILERIDPSQTPTA